MKQIGYLTMMFLPASFLAVSILDMINRRIVLTLRLLKTVFGMNVREVTDGGHETVLHYVIGTLLLTFATIWMLVAFQSDHSDERRTTFLRRLAWPYFLMKKEFKSWQERRALGGRHAVYSV